MEERILKLAMAAAGAGEAERTLLEPLCAAAMALWRGRLREGTAEEDCGEAFLCAAALTAAAGLTAGGEGVESFSVGDVSVKLRSGGAESRAERLHRTAAELMEPFVRAGDLWVREVLG